MKKVLPTIRDVAKAAGVSTATVLKFLSGAQRFSPNVETTITSVVAHLGYRPNNLARSMITGQTKTIGVAVLDISNPHFASVVKGANRIAIPAGYTLLLVDIKENSEGKLQLLESASRQVDGLLATLSMPSKDIRTVIDYGKPVVFFGRLVLEAGTCVGSDARLGGYILAQHLNSQGYSSIAYLGFSRSSWNADRLAGVRERLAFHGTALQCYEAQAPLSSEGERLCSLILLDREHPDALIFYNDLLAIGFIREARSLGFEIPQDVAIAGFDNVPFANYVSPTLISVDIQSEEMGEIAMEKMLGMLSGRATEECTVLAPRLIPRESTGSLAK